MGVAITELLKKEPIKIEALRNKKLGVDTFNLLYQFLTTIRSRDGSLLKDSQGNVTSHLTGLFTRTIKLMSYGIKLAFIFDGEAPKLKQQEQERRAELKIKAEIEHKKAVEEEDIEAMKKYAQRTARLSKEMIEEAKSLIEAMGCPVIQAPSEGEAQAAYMTRKGDLYAVVSQDIDAILFGAPKVIRNLSISTKRKLPGKLASTEIEPELVDSKELLEHLGIDHDQLIVLGVLVGTDFNPGGIKGIGPKTAIKLVKQYGHDFDRIFKEVKWDEYFDFSWKEVFELFKKMKTTDSYKLEWKAIDENKVIEILVNKHDFSLERVKSTLDKLKESQKEQKQKGLGDFF